ncbi:1068_t:CDS:2, partial [Cetraspora pellucida]
MAEWIFRRDFKTKPRGTEAQKDRPGVIISNNKQNQFSGAVIMALITSQFDKVYPFEVEIEVEGKRGKILTDQIYTVDKSRLGRKMGVLNEKELKELVTGLHVVLELGDCKPSEGSFLVNLLDKFKFLLGVCIWASLGVLGGGLLLVLFKNKGQIIIDNTPEFLEFCKKSNGLVFFGSIGSGKTAILAMLANELPGENKYATFPLEVDALEIVNNMNTEDNYQEADLREQFEEYLKEKNDGISLQSILDKLLKSNKEQIKGIKIDDYDKKFCFAILDDETSYGSLGNKKLCSLLKQINGGELDLSGYSNLELISINGNYLKKPLTKLILGGELEKLGLLN